jgi:hypothetical protein
MKTRHEDLFYGAFHQISIYTIEPIKLASRDDAMNEIKT